MEGQEDGEPMSECQTARDKPADLIGKVEVPVGASGAWAIQQFTVSDDDAKQEWFRAQVQALQGRRYVPVPAGDYTRLIRDGIIVMSDTPSEMADHAAPVRRATGRVFIAGLGLGMVLQAVLDKPEVEHATVLELSEDVYKLVAPHYLWRYGPERLTIVKGDVMTWTPPKGTHRNPYDVAWFDIWDTKSGDNLDEFTRIKRRWSRWAKWRGFWAEDIIRYSVRRGCL